MSKDSEDNRSNQMNPNNDAYYQSRGYDSKEDYDDQQNTFDDYDDDYDDEEDEYIEEDEDSYDPEEELPSMQTCLATHQMNVKSITITIIDETN